jgi:hypothetical protein
LSCRGPVFGLARLLRSQAASILGPAPIGILTAVLPIGRKIDIHADRPMKVADRSPTRPAEKLLKKMCASRGLWRLSADERSASEAANTPREVDMTTTGRPGATKYDAVSHSPVERFRGRVVMPASPSTRNGASPWPSVLLRLARRHACRSSESIAGVAVCVRSKPGVGPHPVLRRKVPSGEPCQMPSDGTDLAR